jgi:hypothetical protein
MGFFVWNAKSRVLGHVESGADRHSDCIYGFCPVRFCLNSQNTPSSCHFGLRYNPEVVAFPQNFRKKRLLSQHYMGKPEHEQKRIYSANY